MDRDQLRNINPNHLHGCHPSDLSSHFGETLFHLRAKKVEKALPAISSRLRLLERILNDVLRSDLPAKEHLAEYIHQRYRRNCRRNTLRNAATSMKQFLSFYLKTGKPHIEQMTREDIEAFTEELQDRGLKLNTVSSRLRTVYAFVRFLIEGKVLGYELLERRIKIRLPDRLPRAIDPEDLQQLLSVIDQIRDRVLILLLLRTGMRIGELLHTKVHDVDLNNHRILICQADKTGVGRVAYYSDDAKEALLSWLRVRSTFKENLFYGRSRSSLCYEAARCMFNKYLEKAGLSYSGYTLHRLRNTMATQLLNAEAEVKSIQDLLGHNWITTTQRYCRVSNAKVQRDCFKAMRNVLQRSAQPLSNQMFDSGG